MRLSESTVAMLSGLGDEDAHLMLPAIPREELHTANGGRLYSVRRELTDGTPYALDPNGWQYPWPVPACEICEEDVVVSACDDCGIVLCSHCAATPEHAELHS